MIDPDDYGTAVAEHPPVAPPATPQQGVAASAPPDRIPWLSTAEIVVGLIRTMTVPVLIVFVLTIFHGAIWRIINMLPDKFDQADKASAFGITLEIQEKASATGAPELAPLIGTLSQPALRYLLSTSVGTGLFGWTGADDAKVYIATDNEKMESLKELEAKSFMVCNYPISAWEKKFAEDMVPAGSQPNNFELRPELQKDYIIEERKLADYCKLSAAGTKAYELIVQVVSQQIAAASTAKRASASPPGNSDPVHP